MLSTFFKYRLHVSLCFLVFFLLLNKSIYQGSELWWMAAAFTLLNLSIYLFNKATDVHVDRVNKDAASQVMVPLLYYSSALFFLLPLLWLRSNVIVLLIYIAVGFIGLWYSHVMLGFRLKQVFLIKNLSAAVIWTVPLVLVGVIEAGISVTNMALLGVVFLAVLAVEAMWDVRDRKGDAQYKIKTLPNLVGVGWTKIISLGYLVLGMFFVWKYSLPSNVAILLAILVVFVVETHEDRTPAYYNLVLTMWMVVASFLLF